ncbi:hypothetical protein B0H15DRAFT_988137 [Mycena belliarum]|uniref:Uncharacterized protein n=1 Tax=Mycena belliarum TaxID=1033014 RepID=A0AAD6U595_9AGAR|nr:hypothetical protein B0H15DRAFT_988137 [Mycena belliae]
MPPNRGIFYNPYSSQDVQIKHCSSDADSGHISEIHTSEDGRHVMKTIAIKLWVLAIDRSLMAIIATKQDHTDIDLAGVASTHKLCGEGTYMMFNIRTENALRVGELTKSTDINGVNQITMNTSLRTPQARMDCITMVVLWQHLYPPLADASPWHSVGQVRHGIGSYLAYDPPPDTVWVRREYHNKQFTIFRQGPGKKLLVYEAYWDESDEIEPFIVYEAENSLRFLIGQGVLRIEGEDSILLDNNSGSAAYDMLELV